MPAQARPSVPEDLSIPDLLVAVAGPASIRSRLDGVPLEDIARLAPCELLERGIPPGSARRIACAFELGRRLGPRKLARGQVLTSTSAVFDSYRLRLGHLEVEQMWLIALDAKNRVIREVLLSQGTLTTSLVHPREVFRQAIRAAAVGVVLVHNHPSGDPEPSPDDEAVTRRLVAVSELVGIKLLDHLVVTDSAYVSLLERGAIPP